MRGLLLIGAAIILAMLSASPIFVRPASAKDIQPASVRRDEPFHTTSVAVPNGRLVQKWQPVERAIENELETVSGCAQTSDERSVDGATHPKSRTGIHWIGETQ